MLSEWVNFASTIVSTHFYRALSLIMIELAITIQDVSMLKRLRPIVLRKTNEQTTIYCVSNQSEVLTSLGLLQRLMEVSI